MLKSRNHSQNRHISPHIATRKRQGVYRTNKRHTTCTTTVESSQRASSPSYNKIQVDDILLRQSLSHAQNVLSSKVVSSEDLTTMCLEQIKNTSKMNAYISVLPDSALDMAQASDDRRTAGSILSPIDGIPISIKDNFNYIGSETTAGSKILKGYKSAYNATVVQRLIDAGAVILGKTNLDEFGMGSYGTNSAYGPTYNRFTPQDSSSTLLSSSNTTYIPGGSSSGSAVSLSQYTCYASIGSDTGGSVRLPAAYTGIVGLKPTYGVLSRHGLVSYASSFDTPGIMARTIQDVRTIFNIIAGPDSNDSTCIFTPIHTPSLVSEPQQPIGCPVMKNTTIYSQDDTSNSTDTIKNTNKKGPLDGITIGIPRDLIFADLHPSISSVWHNTAELMSSLGANVVSLSIPSLDHILPSYYTLVQAEAVANLARYDGIRYGYTHYNNTQGYDMQYYTYDTKNMDNNGSNVTDSSSTCHTTSTSPSNTTPNIIMQPNDNPKITATQKLYSTNRELGFGNEVKRRLTIGNYVLSSQQYSSYVDKAMSLRHQIAHDLSSILTPIEEQINTNNNNKSDNSNNNNNNNNKQRVDMLLLPISTTPPPTVEQLNKALNDNDITGYIDDVMTVVANLAGLPALSLPVATTTTTTATATTNSDSQTTLPLSMQLIGPALSEHRLLDVGHVLQMNVKL